MLFHRSAGQQGTLKHMTLEIISCNFESLSPCTYFLFSAVFLMFNIPGAFTSDQCFLENRPTTFLWMHFLPPLALASCHGSAQRAKSLYFLYCHRKTGMTILFLCMKTQKYPNWISRKIIHLRRKRTFINKFLPEFSTLLKHKKYFLYLSSHFLFWILLSCISLHLWARVVY